VTESVKRTSQPNPVASTDRTRHQERAKRTVQQILDEEGHFAWSDGTSIYRLEKNHSFTLKPVGVSGRTIEGKWTLLDGQSSKIQVFGRWLWLNGASAPDDYRKMTIHISGPAVRKSERAGLYQPFFGIEELVKISKEQYQKGIRQATGR